MDEPWIRLVERPRGTSEAVVYVKGYLSDGDDSEEEEQRWVECLREAGWKGAVYHLWWDSSNVSGLASSAVKGAAVGARAGPPGLLAGALFGTANAIRHWKKVKSRAKRVGTEHLEGLIRETVLEPKVSLIGHSLGARVTYFAVLNSTFRFENAILLGGAIRRDSSRHWGQMADRLNGRLVNVYNNYDMVLTALTKTINLRQNPCGRKPIKELHDKIVNVEDPGSGNHWHYKRHMSKTVGPVLWSPVSP